MAKGGRKKGQGRGKPARKDVECRQLLTDRQRLFAECYVRLKNAAAAAREAGYADPEVKGPQLISFDYFPLVAKLIQEKLAASTRIALLDGAGVLNYIHNVMTFSPVDHFLPGGDGGWLADLKDFRALPREVKQIIEEMELRTVDLGEGRLSNMVWVRFVSKTVAMGLAAKYQLPVPGRAGDGSNGVMPPYPGAPAAPAVDWDRLAGARRDSHDDPVERTLLALEAPKDPPPAPPG